MLRSRLLPLLALLLALLPVAGLAQQLPGMTPVEGRDYVTLPGGQRWSTDDDRIEVAEIFAYTCHHCADFQPLLAAWKRRQPADVRVEYVPAAFRPTDNYARACFAAQALGVIDRIQAPLFRAIHDTRTVPASNASVDELAVFFRDEGVDPASFRSAMADPGVDVQMRRAYDFAVASGMRGTPTLIVDGKYRVQGGATHEQRLRIAEQLVAMVRAARKQP